MKKISLFKSTAWYVIGNILIRFLSFALLPIYSNLIGVTDFGNYALLISIYSIVSVVFQFGTQSVLNKFYIEEPDKYKRKLIFSTIFNSIIILGLLLIILFAINAKLLSIVIFGTNKFSVLLIIIFFTVLVDVLGVYVISLLKTNEEAKKSVYYSSIGAIINFLFNIIFVYVINLSVNGIILAQLVSSTLVLILLTGTIKVNYVYKIDSMIFKKVLFFSLPLVFANLFTSGVNFGDRFILNHYLGRDEVGLYSFAYRIALAMNVLAVAFNSAWAPRSIKLYYRNDYKDYYGKILSALISVSCLILIVVTLLSSYLFKIHFLNITFINPIYSSGIIIIPFIMVGYIFTAISYYYSVYPYVSNKSYHFLFADFLALVINISINIILIPKIKIIGAAIATTVALFSSAAYMYTISRNRIIINYRVKELLIIIISTALILIVGLNIANLIIRLSLILLFLLILQFGAKIKITEIIKKNYIN